MAGIKTTLLNGTLISGALLCALPLVMPGTSLAQAQVRQTPPANSQQPAVRPAPTTDEATRVEEVVVTGSRIRRNSEFSSASPVQVITTEVTDLKGIPDAAAALQTSSVAAGSFQLNDQLTGFNTAGGGGTQALSLRGLGEQRTLTLLNGRRAGPAGTRGQVQAFDLNVIPQSQVDRYDILKDGASSIYGSDAIAGVVNILTRRNLDGGAINVFASEPVEGGGQQYRIDGAYGRVFDRGYFSVSAEHYRSEPLRRADRDDTRCVQDFVFQPTTGVRLDYTDPATGQLKCFNLANGYVQASGQNLVPTARYGSLYNYAVPGNNSPFPGFQRWGRAGYPATYTYGPYDSALWNRSTLISPAERTTVNFTGGFNLTPGIEAYTELLYNKRESDQYGVAQIFQSFAQLNTLFGAPNSLPASNPNNLLGVSAVTVTPYESSSHQNIDYYRAVIGLRGDAAFAGRDWNWDVYGQYSLSDGVYDNGPRLYLDRFLALNSPNVACTNTPLGGNVSNFNCSSLPGGIPWMSNRVLAGQFTDAERAFLFVEEEGTTTYTHAYVEGLLTTERLIGLPAGDVGAAFGFHIRREELDDQPPAQAAARNIALFTSAGRTQGSDTVREVFAELELPLIRNAPLVDDLTLNLSGRVSDYDSYGMSETFKVGANWQVTPEWRARASYGNSFRAPSLYELYLGNQTGYGSQSAVDPCYQYATSGVGTDIQNACLALGIPGDYNASGGSSATIFTNGGAGVLEAETADTMNLGLIWTPGFADFSMAVDYFEATIEDEVRQFGAYNIIEQCLKGKTDFCSLFTRNTAFNVVTVNNSYVNVAQQDRRGIDLTLRYGRDLGFGQLTLSSQNSWSLEDRVNLLGGSTEDNLGTTYNYAGPAFAGNIDLTLAMGDWTWFYGVNMIGRGSDLSQPGVNEVDVYTRYADLPNGISSADCSAANSYCVRFKLYTEFTSYHTTSLRYQTNGWTFQAGLNNLFDERPPTVSTGGFRTGTAALNGYDMRGRRAFFRIGRVF